MIKLFIAKERPEYHWPSEDTMKVIVQYYPSLYIRQYRKMSDLICRLPNTCKSIDYSTSSHLYEYVDTFESIKDMKSKIKNMYPEEFI